MTKRVVVSALCCALWVLTTGCGDECVDAFDCRNDNGQPDQGQEWSCTEDNECVQRPVTEPPPADAGTDAGTGTDAGVDAGIDAGTDAGIDAGTDAGTDAGVDAGTDAGTDAGSMSVPKNGACISSADCQAGLRCEAAAGATNTTCQAMHIAVTAVRDSDNVVKALVTRFDTPEPTALTAEDTSSRYPRWGPGGTKIAFARGAVESSDNAENQAGELVVRDIPLGDAAPSVLADGTTGNTRSFRYMEWEPGNSILYVRRNATGGTSGLTLVPTNGGAITEPTTAGTFPDWRDATTFAYSTATQGISTSTVGGTPARVTNAGETAEQPHYNRANDQILFLANPTGRSVTFEGDTSATPLPRLYNIPVSGSGEVSLIADYTSTPIEGGMVESYIANPNWAPDGSWVAYVRAYYFKPTEGNAVLCNGTNCGGQAGNDVVVRRINPTTGAPADNAAEARLVPGGTLPSFSPDGRYIAYIQGGELYVQEINPATGATVGNAIRHTSDTYTIQTRAGDDHRPRWQPK